MRNENVQYVLLLFVCIISVFIMIERKKTTLNFIVLLVSTWVIKASSLPKLLTIIMGCFQIKLKANKNIFINKQTFGIDKKVRLIHHNQKKIDENYCSRQ